MYPFDYTAILCYKYRTMGLREKPRKPSGKSSNEMRQQVAITTAEAQEAQTNDGLELELELGSVATGTHPSLNERDRGRERPSRDVQEINHDAGTWKADRILGGGKND